jgi:hypothetical protein
MLPEISSFINIEFYNSKLINANIKVPDIIKKMNRNVHIINSKFTVSYSNVGSNSTINKGEAKIA